MHSKRLIINIVMVIVGILFISGCGEGIGQNKTVLTTERNSSVESEVLVKKNLVADTTPTTITLPNDTIVAEEHVVLSTNDTADTEPTITTEVNEEQRDDTLGTENIEYPNQTELVTVSTDDHKEDVDISVRDISTNDTVDSEPTTTIEENDTSVRYDEVNVTQESNQTELVTVTRDEYNESADISVNVITQMLEDSAKGIRHDVHYHVLGDSTREYDKTTALAYYTQQLKKINISFDYSARYALRAYQWLDGTSPLRTIDDTLALIPEDQHSNYILEFSLGINDMRIGHDRDTVFQTLLSCIQTLQTARPDMKILLVSPVSHTIVGIPNTSEDLESIYRELSTILALPLVSAKLALDGVYYDFSAADSFNRAFYLDPIHPNSDGSIRFINYIFSEMGGEALHDKMTITDSPTMSREKINEGLEIKLKVVYNAI